jgi:hypothetical protein
MASMRAVSISTLGSSGSAEAAARVRVRGGLTLRVGFGFDSKSVSSCTLFSYSADEVIGGVGLVGREWAKISGTQCAHVTNERSVVVDARAYEVSFKWKRLNSV